MTRFPLYRCGTIIGWTKERPLNLVRRSYSQQGVTVCLQEAPQFGRQEYLIVMAFNGAVLECREAPSPRRAQHDYRALLGQMQKFLKAVEEYQADLGLA